MTERVFEDKRSWEVSGGGRSVEVYVFPDNNLMITATEDASWDCQRASFTISAEEATRLKQFLIRKGY